MMINPRSPVSTIFTQGNASIQTGAIINFPNCEGSYTYFPELNYPERPTMMDISLDLLPDGHSYSTAMSETAK